MFASLPMERYVDGSQELMHVLENYRTNTSTGFSNAQSLAVALKPIDETQLRTRFLSVSSKPRLFWQMNAGEPKIPYDGVPFISIGQITDLPCVRYGGRRKKSEQVTLPSGDIIPVDCRQKAGCDAKITIRRVARYPSAAYVEPAVSPGVGQVRRSRKLILDDLGAKIASGVTKPSERYFVLLPTPMAHSGHEVAEIESTPHISQPVSDAVLSQLSNGVTNIVKIRAHCKSIVNNLLGTEASLRASDKAYFPSEYDIFRHVYWLYKAGQVIDQEAALQASMGTIESLAQSISTPPPKADKVPVTTSAEVINSVYSMIMDDSSSSSVSALGHLGDDLGAGDNTLDSIDTTLTGMSSTSSSIATNLSQLVKRAAQTPKSTQATPLASNRPTDYIVDDSPAIIQAQREVRDMLRILENQTHACLNESALNGLRRQLTELCSQFSMYLAGVPSPQFGPPSKKIRL
ncbi:calcium-responsive transcription factor-like isoform X2 [Halichondria panicea]|uniref:calcium-responsive transcription factor-like isoform X2 n=1 Tax=Halichondria panicea TaxID=6063 RepID=UPI00312BBDE7